MTGKLASLHITLILMIFAAANSRAQSPEYLPNVLVIKYEEESILNEIHARRGQDPKNSIRNYLDRFGARTPQPAYRSGRSSPRKSGADAFGADPGKELRRIHTVRYTAAVDPAYLAAKVSRLPGIEYAEPRYIRRLQETITSDTVKNSYETFHRFRDAWDETHGSPDVVIAIVDAGVAYEHPELDNKLWVNSDEIPPAVRSQVDQDGNGRVTGGEIRRYLQNNGADYNGDGSISLRDALHANSDFTTGTDSDGNGYADDLFGWDFWASGTTSGSFTEDNDPYMDANDHGTHVAGIAAAETDNDSTGIAGTGFDVRYMAVKAGGIPQEPNSIGFGFEGILYAAENGADLINCSWGGPAFSQAEQDAVDFVSGMGALLVGAAGNNGQEGILHPAAYDNALAVGSVETDNRIAFYSNYGYELDVLATGTGIYSIACEAGSGRGPDCPLTIRAQSGTSMATPVVSGLAGLIRSLHPGWSAQRLATQIRGTSADIDVINSNSLGSKLGKGKIDADKAVTIGNLPGIRILSHRFVNDAGDKLGIEEQGSIDLSLANYGASTVDLALEPVSLNGPGIEFGIPVSVDQMGPDDTTQVSIPIRITDSYDFSQLPEIRVNFEDASRNYADFDVLPYEGVMYDNMNANRVKMSIAANGTIGFANPFTGKGGIGFIPREPAGQQYEDGENLLFEGGVILQIDGQIHDAVRESALNLSRDFDPVTTFRRGPGGRADQEGSTIFVTDSSGTAQARIRLTSYAFEEPGLSNVVYLQYQIENSYSHLELKEIYLGIFNDWDIGADPVSNSTAFVEQDSILYLYDEDPQSTQPVVAVSHIGNLSSAFAIDNAAQQSGPGFGIYDGFTESEKQLSLNAGTGYTTITGTDVSAVIASGPYTLKPRASASIGFVYAFGADVNELRTQILEARSRTPFEVTRTGTVLSNPSPDITKIFQNYPNPFNNSTRIRVDLSQPTDVNIAVYNILGRRVAQVVDERLDASIHIFTFDARALSSGLYFARLQAGGRTETIKMVLVK